MQIVLSSRLRQAVVGVLLTLSWPMPGMAQSLFARHQVTVEFIAGGQPLADAEVRVFAPDEKSRPAFTGRTDSNGHFEFNADRDGFWTAEAREGGRIARVLVRVGGKPVGEGREALSPYWALGGLVLLLILAFAYRIARTGLRRQANPPGLPPQKP